LIELREIRVEGAKFGETIGKWLTGGSELGGWLGGVACGSYTTAFASAELSGASFDEATRAGAQAAGNPNTYYTAAAMELVKVAFAEITKTAEPAKKPTEVNGGKPVRGI